MRNSAPASPKSVAHLFLTALRWLALAVAIGLLAGVASDLLILSLNWATSAREAHRWFIALLPLGGFAVGLLYHYFGRSVEAGNDLILEEIYLEAAHPSRVIPARMTPLILIGTTLTHLFGGSAGREGSAVQAGASLADQIARVLRLHPRLQLSPNDRRILLMAGMSAGFGSVFGIPLAGAVFGLEVVALGAVTYRAVLPCLIASFAADFTTRALGEFPTAYIVPAHDLQAMFLGPRSLLFAALAGAVFGLAAALFALLTHRISGWCQRTVRYAPLRPLLGGAVLAALVFDTHAFRYIGLGVPTIVEAFAHPLPRYAFAAKILLTALTLGAGFKGGEVTPLFFIGATLGNALASLLPLPTGILAAMGFVAVFAGAAKTPLASSVMAFSLFGPEVGALAAVACLTSYMCSGRMGIYRAQPRSGPVRMIPRLRHAPETSVATRSRLPHP